MTSLPRLALVGLSLVLVPGACGAEDGEAGASSTTTSTGSVGAAAAAAPTSSSTVSAQPAASASSGAVAVAIAGFAFVPSPVTVPPGGTVTWTNSDGAPHSVSDASPMATPESKSLNKGDAFSITYPQPGTFPYVCGIHNYMQGSVEVKA